MSCGQRLGNYPIPVNFGPLAVLRNCRMENTTMSTLSTFFRESDTALGCCFYPKHYVIATFPSHEAAKDAHRALLGAGFTKDDVNVSTGDEVLKFFEHFREDAGLWGIVMRPLSRLLNTEVAFADRDIESARGGSGFIAAHSPTDETARRITELVKPFAPSSIEWYLAGGIRSLM